MTQVGRMMRMGSGVAGALLVLFSAAAQAQPNPVLLKPDDPFWKARAPDLYRARFETTKGPVVIEVHREWSPHGADRFYNLIRAGYYNDSRFSRVVRDWIVQWGVAGDPKIARLWYDQYFPDDSVRQSNVRGFVAFSMTGPNKRTTQLFISKGDNSRQDPQGFSPIGQVVEGMEVVDSIHNGYGEDSGGGVRAGKQGPLVDGGNAFADKNYPLLDHLIKATIL